MIQSMTGFGSAERNGCRIEIRSINHRFLDIYMRMPPGMSQLDVQFRGLIREFFSRGKIDVTVTLAGQAAAEPAINKDLVRKIMAAFRGLQDELSIGGEIDVNTLVNLHDMFLETGEKYDAEMMTDVFRAALADLGKMRAREGESLAAAILPMTEALAEMNVRIREISAGLPVLMRDRFRERLKALLEGMEPDEGKMLQEAAALAARLDVSEEVARIESHLAQFKGIVKKGGIIGRKLDFILQELNREVNTVASKSAEYDLSSLTVDMKTEIEKIREQVQNIQ